MIEYKNKERRQRYLNDCFTREEFYKFLGDDYLIKSSDSGQKESFSDFSINQDSLDYTIWTIHYPMPLVKEISITNWAGGWGSDQSHIHFEYDYPENYRWRMKKLLKFDNPKRLEETDEFITKEEIFPQIIQFINHIDEEKSKQLLRNFNLNQLV